MGFSFVSQCDRRVNKWTRDIQSPEEFTKIIRLYRWSQGDSEGDEVKSKQKSGSKPAAVLQPATNGHYNIGDRAVLEVESDDSQVDTYGRGQEGQPGGCRPSQVRCHDGPVREGSGGQEGVGGHADSAAKELRRIHNYYTRPWTDGGVRILSGAGYFTHNKKIMDAFEGRPFDKAADVFIDKFDECVARVEKRQGSLFDRSEYPTAERLRKAYGVDIRVASGTGPFPILRGSGSDGPGDEMKQIEKSTATTATTAIENAMKDTFSRLAKVVETAAETLREFKRTDDGKVVPGCNFKSSLTGNINDLLEIGPATGI